MKRRPRIYYTEAQKALMWHRWQKGETLHAIDRRAKSDPVWVRENRYFLTLERIKVCPKECA